MNHPKFKSVPPFFSKILNSLLRLVALCAALQSLSVEASSEITEDDFIDLIYAIRLGNAEGVIAGLDKGIPVGQIDGDYHTLMWHAISAEQPEIMELLADRGYDWSSRSDGRSPVTEDFGAALQSNLETLQLYVREGSEAVEEILGYRQRGSDWPEQISRADPELLEYCVEIGLLPQSQRMYAEVLEHAIINHNNEMVDFLLRRNWARIHPSIVSVAVYYDNEIALEKLIEKGLSLDQGMHEGVSLRGVRFELGSPLVSAVMAHNLSMVERFLEAGVDPGANDNAAILWADALGNKAIYDRLLAAGAEEPEPFAFFDYEPFTYLLSASNENRPVKRENYSWELGSILNSLQSENDDSVLQPDGRPIKVGIIQLSEGLDDPALLLEATLSKTPDITLVDRSQLRVLMGERSLRAEFASEVASELGALTGADAILYLRKIEATIEARIVSTATGLILATYFYTGESDFDSWTKEVVEKGVRNNEARLRVTGEDALLVSIPRIGTNGSSGLESLADQLAVLLGYRLGKEPNIFLLDRNELQRLTLEQGLAQKTSEFFRSAWVIDGFMDRAEDPEQLILEIRLQRGLGREEERIVLEADIENPQPMVEAIVEALLDRDITSLDSDETDTEGRLFFERGLEAHRAGLFGYALASFRTASALGYEKKDLWDATIRSCIRSLMEVRNQLVTINNLEIDLSYLEYLTWPAYSLSGFAYDSEVEDLIDIANLLLDQVEVCLRRNQATKKGDINDLSYLPYAFYNANSVLELLSPLSNRNHHGQQISALRNRLDSLSETAIDWAGKKDLRLLQGELLIMRFASIPYWTDDEAEAMREMDQVFDRIHEPELEAFLYPFFNELESAYGMFIPVARASYAMTFWSRYLKRMQQSEYPHVHLLVNYLNRSNRNIKRHQQSNSPQSLMEQWRRLNEAVETDFRKREFAGDFVNFSLIRPSHDPLELGGAGRKFFNIGWHLSADRFLPPRETMFRMPQEIHPTGQRSALTFKSVHNLLPEFALDQEGIQRDEIVINSRLQRLAQYWQNLYPAIEAGRSRFRPHELVPASHLRIYPLATLEGWRDKTARIYNEILNEITDESERKLFYSPLLLTDNSSPIHEEIRRRESISERESLKQPTLQGIKATDSFVTAKELSDYIDDPRGFSSFVVFFAFRDGSYWINLYRFGVLQLNPKGHLENFFKFPDQFSIMGATEFLHITPDYVIASFDHSDFGRSKDTSWHAILNRNHGTWSVLEHEGLVIDTGLEKNYLVFSIHKDREWVTGGGGGWSPVNHSGYRVIVQHDLITGDEEVLVDTRRVPPISPLDQEEQFDLTRIDPLKGDEFLIAKKQIIDLKTGKWRRANREEIKHANADPLKRNHYSFELEFRGMIYAIPHFPRFQDDDDYLDFHARTPSNSVVQEHQPLRPDFTAQHQLKIPFFYEPETREIFPEQWKAINKWIERPILSKLGFHVSNNGAILASSPVGFTIYTPEEVEAIMEHAWDFYFPLAETPE
ncbi:hypothetical protein [Puniceicoccus vermicola]|uniref:Ankyrin repeat domain-containing protein n=1 Tax=Puniceicoccus vermicola TaxID=388746 RepID=A0A7X1B1U9_9BACT|nr:hypothetical protein [Puniceicoccus vermicola]MBC2602983.1 hypothetical protein [Puniceicoccus vermicola]